MVFLQDLSEKLLPHFSFDIFQTDEQCSVLLTFWLSFSFSISFHIPLHHNNFNNLLVFFKEKKRFHPLSWCSLLSLSNNCHHNTKICDRNCHESSNISYFYEVHTLVVACKQRCWSWYSYKFFINFHRLRFQMRA